MLLYHTPSFLSVSGNQVDAERASGSGCMPVFLDHSPHPLLILGGHSPRAAQPAHRSHRLTAQPTREMMLRDGRARRGLQYTVGPAILEPVSNRADAVCVHVARTDFASELAN